LSKFGGNSEKIELEVLQNAPNMKRNAVVFLESISLEHFLVKLGNMWAKILRIPKNVPAPTPML